MEWSHFLIVSSPCGTLQNVVYPSCQLGKIARRGDPVATGLFQMRMGNWKVASQFFYLKQSAIVIEHGIVILIGYSLPLN